MVLAEKFTFMIYISEVILQLRKITSLFVVKRKPHAKRVEKK